MKTKVWISFSASTIPGGAATVLDPAGCGSDVAQVDDIPALNNIFVDVKLDETDERVAQLLMLLQHRSVDVDTSKYIEYSEEDLQNARLLWMSPDVNENVFAGNMYGTKYDLDAACMNCGAGAQKTSALYIDGDDGPAMIRKHRAIGTRDEDVLIDGGMVKKLKEVGVTGISFGEVRARLKNKKWSMVARDQILISHTMPRMRSELTDDDKKDLCKVCRRGGLRTAPTKPHRATAPYCAEDLVGMQDFNLTWEWFGNFWPKDNQRCARSPHPYVLVTPKVMNIFREAGVTTFEWTPVSIDE